MAQELAFAAPGTEEMTKVAAGVVSAGITGAVEGVIVKMAPQMGAAAPVLTWGTLLGVPLVGIGGALFSRGMISDVLQGVAAAGTAILGYTLPAMLLPEMFGKRSGLTAEQRAALAAGRDIKLLQPGLGDAAQRAQAMAARAGAGLDF